MSPFWFFLVPVGLWFISGLRVIQEYEAGVIFRLGRFAEVKRAGLNWIVPGVDRAELAARAGHDEASGRPVLVDDGALERLGLGRGGGSPGPRGPKDHEQADAKQGKKTQKPHY